MTHGIKGLLGVHQKMLGSHFCPHWNMPLNLVGQCKHQGIGTGVYSLLNKILLRDVWNAWFTPSYIPLALLELQGLLSSDSFSTGLLQDMYQ